MQAMMKAARIAEASKRLRASPPCETRLVEQIAHRGAERPGEDEGAPEQQGAGDVR